MPKTRWTLFYPAAYTTLAGPGFLFAPQWTMKLLLANHQYSDAMAQLAGATLVGLAVVLWTTILYGDRIFYRMTLMVRIPMWLGVLGIYFHTGETLMVVLLCVTGVGILMTGTCYLMERGNSEPMVRSQRA